MISCMVTEQLYAFVFAYAKISFFSRRGFYKRGGLVVSASDSGARGRGVDSYLRRVVSLSKTHSFPKSTGNTQEVVASFQHD